MTAQPTKAKPKEDTIDSLTSELGIGQAAVASLEEKLATARKEVREKAEAIQARLQKHHKTVAEVLGNGLQKRGRPKGSGTTRMTLAEKEKIYMDYVRRNGGECTLTDLRKHYGKETGRATQPVKADVQKSKVLKLRGRARKQAVSLA